METYLLKETGVSGLHAKEKLAEEVMGIARKPALLRLMVLSEFGAEGGMMGKAGQLEWDIAQWGATGAGAGG